MVENAAVLFQFIFFFLPLLTVEFALEKLGIIDPPNPEQLKRRFPGMALDRHHQSVLRAQVYPQSPATYSEKAL